MQNQKKIKTDRNKIQDILTRGVNSIYNKDELEELLYSGQELHLKLGTDVTGPLIHLGHAVVQRKIRDFQELGHKVTLIIGDFTTIVGDHSDKVDMREDRKIEQINEDVKTYTQQFFKTVLKEQTEIRYNSEWLKNLNFNDIIYLAKQFTVAQLLERENFKLRYEAQKPIKLSEFLYPLMQGYDSVILKNHIEFGGTDQTFNILAGRHLMEVFGLKPQIGFIMNLLTGNDGRKMGKSLKNYIPVMAEANEMYSMLMQIVDEVIIQYLELITRIPLEEIKEFQERMNKGENPMIFKKILAYEVVSFYHSPEKAKEAQEEFERVVQKKELPKNIDTILIKKETNIIDVVMNCFNLSKSEVKRLINQKAVKYNDQIIDSFEYQINKRGVLSVGKKRFKLIEIV